MTRYLLVFIAVLLVFNNVFHYLSWQDRRRIHAEFLEVRRQTHVTREMLDARAEIQIIFFRSSIENRPLTAAEIERVKALWTEAEYDRVETR